MCWKTHPELGNQLYKQQSMQTQEGQIHERTRSSNLNDDGHVHVHWKCLNLEVSKIRKRRETQHKDDSDDAK